MKDFERIDQLERDVEKLKMFQITIMARMITEIERYNGK